MFPPHIDKDCVVNALRLLSPATIRMPLDGGRSRAGLAPQAALHTGIERLCGSNETYFGTDWGAFRVPERAC